MWIILIYSMCIYISSYCYLSCPMRPYFGKKIFYHTCILFHLVNSFSYLKSYSSFKIREDLRGFDSGSNLVIPHRCWDGCFCPGHVSRRRCSSLVTTCACPVHGTRRFTRNGYKLFLKHYLLQLNTLIRLWAWPIADHEIFIIGEQCVSDILE